jgi:hypothetical protein
MPLQRQRRVSRIPSPENHAVPHFLASPFLELVDYAQAVWQLKRRFVSRLPLCRITIIGTFLALWLFATKFARYPSQQCMALGLLVSSSLHTHHEIRLDSAAVGTWRILLEEQPVTTGANHGHHDFLFQ